MKRTGVFFIFILLMVSAMNNNSAIADVVYVSSASDSTNDVELVQNGSIISGNISTMQYLDVIEGSFNISNDMKYVQMTSTFAETPIFNASTEYFMTLTFYDDFNTSDNIRTFYYIARNLENSNDMLMNFGIFYQNGTQFQTNIELYNSTINSTTNTWYASFRIDQWIQLIEDEGLQTLYTNSSLFTTEYYIASIYYPDFNDVNNYYIDEARYTNVGVLPTTNSSSVTNTSPASFEFYAFLPAFIIGVIVKKRKS